MAHGGQQPGVEGEWIEQAVSVHGLDDRAGDPCDAARLGHLVAGDRAFAFHGIAQALAHRVELRRGEKGAEVDVAVFVERLAFGGA